MKHNFVMLWCICATVSSLSLYSFTIINQSTSPKNVEVFAFLPDKKESQVILKKTLSPQEKISAPFTLREVAIDIHWGDEQEIKGEDKIWKPIETDTQKATTWKLIQALRCIDPKNKCHVVIPPSWHLEEDTNSATIITDQGEKIHVSSPEECHNLIPYRKVTDVFPKERIITQDPETIAHRWKRLGIYDFKHEELVIPVTWSLKEEGNQRIITTDTGRELRLRVKQTINNDPTTEKPKTYTHDRLALIPYRYKDGVVTELCRGERIFVIKETNEKPFKTHQYNLFRRFSAQEAEPRYHARGIPRVLTNDHVFEIIGSDYETDIMFSYVPEENPKIPSARETNNQLPLKQKSHTKKHRARLNASEKRALKENNTH